jgi:hypothetical protein
MIYKGRTRYIINAYNINIAIQFISTIIAMQSSVPSLSCLADSNLNMCLQKWFQRKMWNYDKVNNSRSWIFCISITLIKCETVNLFLFSLNTLPNKKIMHCCLTGNKMIHSSIGYLCHILYKWYKQLYFLIQNHAYANMTNGICLNIHHNTHIKITPPPPCWFSQYFLVRAITFLSFEIGQW